MSAVTDLLSAIVNQTQYQNLHECGYTSLKLTQHAQDESETRKCNICDEWRNEWEGMNSVIKV